MTTLDLLTQAEPRIDDRCLVIASRIAFPLAPLEVVKNTQRFKASYAIEVLRKAILMREDAASLSSRLAHAISETRRWVKSFD